MWEAGGKNGGEGWWGGNGNGNEQTQTGIIIETHLCAYLGCNMEKQGLNMDESSC